VRVFRAAGSGPPRLITTTDRRSVRVPARAGARYAFYTQALDRAGNLESAPGTPDARTSVPR
jgi:hypothetical protein